MRAPHKVRTICKHCGQDITFHAEITGPEWWDEIGYGCTGRGQDGDILPHEPAR